MYLPLWTSLLVAMHDDIENTSVCICVYTLGNNSTCLDLGKLIENLNPQECALNVEVSVIVALQVKILSSNYFLSEIKI